MSIEHASLSAHSTGVGCEARGQVVYSTTSARLWVKVDRS